MAADKEIKPEEQSDKDVPQEEPPKIQNIPPAIFAKDRTIILKELPKGVGVPKYFWEPDSDPVIMSIEKDEAILFLRGPYNIGTDKDPKYVSFSAKVMWIGKSRRFISKQVAFGTISTSPQKNFWRIAFEGVRFWRNQEAAQLIKDPDFIRECLQSKNWKIRFIIDEAYTPKKAEGRMIKRNVQQWLGHPYRLREGAIKLGQAVPLHPGEAALILERLKTKAITIDSKFSHITKYLEERKKADIEKEKQEAEIAAAKAKEEKN